MPKLGDSYDSAAESTATEQAALVPGVYMCRVQAIRTEWTDARGATQRAADKQYVKVILDIDEGEHAGRFSDDYWSGEARDWGHTLFMSWKETAYGILKHTFSAFDEANERFDAKAAFLDDRWADYIGKRLRVVWNGEEYETDQGYTRMRVRPDRAVTEGDKPVPKVAKLDGRKVPYADYLKEQEEKTAEPPRRESAYMASDLPF